jgi:hypothetical protein
MFVIIKSAILAQMMNVRRPNATSYGAAVQDKKITLSRMGRRAQSVTHDYLANFLYLKRCGSSAARPRRSLR